MERLHIVRSTTICEKSLAEMDNLAFSHEHTLKVIKPGNKHQTLVIRSSYTYFTNVCHAHNTLVLL